MSPCIKLIVFYNIEEFKKLFRKGALIEKAANSELRWLDQDLINILAKGRIKPLNNQLLLVDFGKKIFTMGITN